MPAPAAPSATTPRTECAPDKHPPPAPRPKRRGFRQYLRQDATHDLGASVVVFLVAIPLSLGVAAASGAPLAAGLIAAVVGGLIAGAFSGAPLQVSGAAAGLTVVVAELIHQYGFAATAAITIAAGAVQIVLGVTKVGRAALSLSPAVVHGMLAGIGVVIVVSQVHVLLGGVAQTSVIENIRELPAQLVNHNSRALALGLLAIAILLGWPRLKHTKLKRLASIPAPLVAVLASTGVAATAQLTSSRAIPVVALPDKPLQALTTPQLPNAGATQIILAVATIAIIASVESLLSAVAVDKLHTGERAKLDKELVAQGVANMASGTLGGLPVTGVIVRSTANVAAGARTRASGMLHGLWVLGALLFGVAALEHIPLAALAAVLIVVGASLVKLGHLRTLHRHHELIPYLVTMSGVVFANVLEGVVLGLAAAALVALYRLAHARIHVSYVTPGRWHADIRGTVTFLSVGRMLRELRAIPPGQHVAVDLHTDFLDHAAYEALRDWRAGYLQGGGHIDIHEEHGSWFRRANAGAPARRKNPTPHVLPRWFAPWSQWQQSDDNPRATADEHPMIIGVQEFQHRAAPLVRPVLSQLASAGQNPHQLFVTCADSRVLPNLITTSGPGDLFCVRNVGNFVPRHGNSTDDSVGAGIEFAVDGLRVTSVAVCGHSDCGAMKALVEKNAPAGSHLNAWLSHGVPSVERARRHAHGPTPVLGVKRARQKRHSGKSQFPSASVRLSELSQVDQLCVHNVLQQLDHLRSYPSVAAAQAAGRLELVGMFFDISTAQVYLIDPVATTLHPVELPATISRKRNIA